MKFEDSVNRIIIVATVYATVKEVYTIYKKYKDSVARKVAAAWRLDINIRIDVLITHAISKGISKDAYLEMLTAIKNLVAFEVESVCPNNVYVRQEAREVYAKIDELIASAK